MATITGSPPKVLPSDRVAELAHETRVQEQQRVAKEIRIAMQSGERVFPIAVAVLAAGLTIGLQPAGQPMLMVLPFAFGLLVANQLTNYVEVLMMGGYQRALEPYLTPASAPAPPSHWSSSACPSWARTCGPLSVSASSILTA